MLTILPDEIQELVWLRVAAKNPKTAILASRVSKQTHDILNQFSFWQKVCQDKGINVDPQNENLTSLQGKLMPELSIDMFSAAAANAVRGIPTCKIFVCGKGCLNIQELAEMYSVIDTRPNWVDVGKYQLKFDVDDDNIYEWVFPKLCRRQEEYMPHAVLLCPDSRSQAKECIGFANRNPDRLFFIVRDETRFHLANVVAAVQHKNILAVPQDYEQLCKAIADTLNAIKAHQMSLASVPVFGR